MCDRLWTVRLEQFLKTLPQYSQVSLRPRDINSLRVWGSNKASSLPFCASAYKDQAHDENKYPLHLTLIALGSMGGRLTPGGRGGTGNCDTDLLPPRKPPRPRPPNPPRPPGNIPRPPGPGPNPVGFHKPDWANILTCQTKICSFNLVPPQLTCE